MLNKVRSKSVVMIHDLDEDISFDSFVGKCALTPIVARDRISPGVSDVLTQEIAAAFPGLTSLPRDAQLAQGDQMLEKAARDQHLAGDPKTEPAFPKNANNT